MTPDLFLQVKSQGHRSRGQAISCSRCVDNDYTKGGIMIIITQMALMARQRAISWGETTERRYIKKILKNAKLSHVVVPGAGKRYAASGKALQAESATSKI